MLLQGAKSSYLYIRRVTAFSIHQFVSSRSTSDNRILMSIVVLLSDWDDMGPFAILRLVISSLSMYILLSCESKSCRYSPGFHVNRGLT